AHSPLAPPPARQPLPGPSRLIFGNGRRLAELDSSEIEILRRQRLNRAISGGPAVLEVRDVPPLVGVDATHCLRDAPQERGIELRIEVGAGNPRPVKVG